MKAGNMAGKAWVAVAAALLITTGASQSWAVATNSKLEANCHASLSKGIAKHAEAIVKAMTKCNLANNFTGCPDADATAAIDKSAAKLAKTATKKCHSACSVSELPCISHASCPPNGTTSESCTAGTSGKEFRSDTNMGFPGAYCTAILGGAMSDPEDFGTCAAGLGQLIANEMMDNLFGSATPTGTAAECVAAIAKAAPKTAGKLAGAVSKCRVTQLTADNSDFLADACATEDEKVIASIASSVQKFKDAIAKACVTGDLTTLDLCGNGIGGTATVADAQTCLGTMIEEVSHSVELADERTYAGTSIINGAYPASAAARCGDNLVNQLPNQFALNGEECDGADDDACPGLCFPAGDVFECTCSNVRRARAFADGFGADLDNGWSGSSHNSKVPDGAGFVAEVSNCNCAGFDPAKPGNCIGATSDSNCDVFAEVKPRCSNHIGDGKTCDEVGNINGSNDDGDCQACNAFAGNAGDFCSGSARYCYGGVDSGDRCNDTDDDCTGGTCTGIGRCVAGLFAGNGCIGSQNCGSCVGGINMNNPCSTNSNCPGSTCSTNACTANECIGGANDGNPCTNDAGCTGGRCAVTSDCESKCYDENDVAQGDCWAQTDCPDGQRCKGACDKSNNYCLLTRNGAPLPLSAEGTSACVDSRFFSNVTGTRNIVTGAHAISYELRSLVHLGGANALQSVPCPVCGGYCDIPTSGGYARFRCEGSCSTGPALECRFGINVGQECASDNECGDRVCVGGTNAAQVCTADAQCPGGACQKLCMERACRFDDDCGFCTGDNSVACDGDDDCTGVGTCSTGASCDGSESPECFGGDCRLDLTCSTGENAQQACRIEANTAFGTTSVDCPPYASSNVTGGGLKIVWDPLTSGLVTLPLQAACDAGGYDHFTCNCVTGGGGTRNQPNRCGASCSDPNPAYFGRSCSDFTKCAGGTDAGESCDQNSDCGGGGTCTNTPQVCGAGSTGACSVKHCAAGTNPGQRCYQADQCKGGGVCTEDPCTVGGAACTDGECIADTCATNADCGAFVCGSVCPAGICTPLCVQRGVCTGGDRNGQKCALDIDCVGGGTCDNQDPEEGACAQGHFNHCDGPGWEFVSCSGAQVDTQRGCEMGTDTVLGNTNDNIGAGYCRADVTNCFINNGTAEGGSTANGKGDATDSYSVAAFCIPATGNSAVNSTSGLPGPGRIRQPSLTVPNFSVLP